VLGHATGPGHQDAAPAIENKAIAGAAFLFFSGRLSSDSRSPAAIPARDPNHPNL